MAQCVTTAALWLNLWLLIRNTLNILSCVWYSAKVKQWRCIHFGLIENLERVVLTFSLLYSTNLITNITGRNDRLWATERVCSCDLAIRGKRSFSAWIDVQCIASRWSYSNVGTVNTTHLVSFGNPATKIIFVLQGNHWHAIWRMAAFKIHHGNIVNTVTCSSTAYMPFMSAFVIWQWPVIKIEWMSIATEDPMHDYTDAIGAGYLLRFGRSAWCCLLRIWVVVWTPHQSAYQNDFTSFSSIFL